ncbi:MAG: exosortase A [Propionivibrio sp.]|nr:exosortase A [Propionivibrio sp.]MBL0208227.1 exosortase A [Propionivibrio sp.]
MALPAVVVALFLVVVLYRKTAISVVEIWARSETFTHGFLVIPISIWLVWRIRSNIARLVPRPNVYAFVALASTGFVWLLGELAAVGVLAQFALATMLVLTVPAVLGLPVARRIAFPLAFLYFAVPFGEFALPQLMEWTANFTVLGLRLSGIPVYREGLHFVIPSGSWSVVEACSGVRYIIASLTVGTLFAYLNYHSLKRRVIFIGVAFVVPVIANWIRAYMIVMLGHLSGNTLAVGVDHLIYGWLFFGIVITAMFWIGMRWREEELLHDVEESTASVGVVAANPSFLMATLFVLVLSAIWPLAQWQIERTAPAQVAQIAPIGSIAGWAASPLTFAEWKPIFENPSASLQSTFVSNDGRMAGLYLGYYRNQDNSHKLVSSNNVLVRSSDLKWARVKSGSSQIAFDRNSLTVRTAELRATDFSRLIVWQWYWVDGQLTASDLKAKAYTALSRLTGHGDDSAVIIVYALKDEAGGEATLEAFVQAVAPEIERVLRQTRAEQ